MSCFRNELLSMDKYPLVLAVLGSLLLLSRGGAARDNTTQTLTLLSLVPFFDSRQDAGWDRGIELLPMGRIARDEINQREDILPGYQLEVVEADSDACGYSVTRKAIVNFVSHAIGLNGTATVAGVTGLPCSTVTAMLSPLAGREEVSLIQMSMANSPALRDSSLYPHLWRTVSSSIVYVNATLALMDRFNWSTMSAIYDENGNYYYATARNLTSELRKNESRNVALDIAIDESEEYIESAIDQIKSNGSRIIFVSSTPLEAALVMCAAKQNGLISPGYQWVFHTHTLNTFLSNNDKSVCTDQQMLTAMENIILLQWQLIPDDTNRIVYSGKSVKELQKLYSEELRSLSEENQYRKYASEIEFEEQQPWAYPMYDEVWAIALALNKSLPDLEEKGLTLADYHFGNKLVTQIVEDHLAALSFEGAVGHISFDRFHETVTTIKLFQVRNGTEKLIGKFSMLEGLKLFNASDVQVVDDEFEEVYIQVSLAVRVILYLTNALMFSFTTSLLILTICYRKSPVIKADSALLNSLVFIGCYLICVSSLGGSCILEVAVDKNYYYEVFCNIHIWCWSIGLCLILGTNLVKLARIYQIFNNYLTDCGFLLTNSALFVYALLLGVYPAIILLVWSIYDILEYRQDRFFDLADNPPQVEFIVDCNCRYYAAWLTAIYLYFAFMFLMLIIFAVRTRNIKINRFKDTKKVIFFVVLLTLTLVLTVSSWTILRQIDPFTRQYGLVAVILGNFSICLLCFGFLIAPKVLPVFYEDIATHWLKVTSMSGKTMTEQSVDILITQ